MNPNELKNYFAPSALEINPTYLKLGEKMVKTLFFLTYPRYLSTSWFSPLVNTPELIDISIHITPVDTATALKSLKKKATQVEAQLQDREEKGMIRSPMLETAMRDVEGLRDSLQQAVEHLFTVAVYFTLYADTAEELGSIENSLVNLLESRLIYVKPATFQQVEAFNAVLPIVNDELNISNPLNSSPAASFFPFVSPTLTTDSGTLHGINTFNNTLVIFDRFDLQNANMAIFATSGAGKSYAAKLEALRSLMTGADVIVIDPENEYKGLAEAVGGSFFNISLTSESHINPFDIPIIPKDESADDVLRSHIVNLTGLFKIMLGELSPTEEGVLDRAITETYASRDIIPGKDFSKATAPLISDLETVLRNISGGVGLADRLYRFTEGSYGGFLNQQSNVDIRNRFVVFSVRDLEESLRPIAMYIILNYIWNLIRSELKQRIMVVDEAWWLMKYPEGAAFLFGLVKRARKYYLGVTTITQDVEDFLLSPFGRPIITNSALQILMRQHPATIDIVAKTFNLTDSEKGLLVDAAVGEGLFFAGLNHVAIKIIASYMEDQLITTNPKELLNETEDK